MFLENLVSEALPLPGVWARQAASDCRASLPDEPGLARSQNGGGSDTGWRRLGQGRWSSSQDHLGHLICFPCVFAEQTAGLQWTSFRERPGANEALN